MPDERYSGLLGPYFERKKTAREALMTGAITDAEARRLEQIFSAHYIARTTDTVH